MSARTVTTLLVLVCVSNACLATPVDYLHGDTWVCLEGWADDGSPDPANVAVTVIDFGDVSYAFGYKWSGSAYGSDMLLALDAQTDLDVQYTDWGGSLGISVDSFSYAGQVATSDWVNTWLGYWASDDGVTWTPQATGVSGRALSDGDWDGWSLETDVVTYTLQNPPDTPAVPEPGSVWLLVAGTLALLNRGRAIRPE